jgi:hypothetical protein
MDFMEEAVTSPPTQIQPAEPEFVNLLRITSLAESIPWNRFLGSLNVYKYGLYSRLIALYREGLCHEMFDFLEVFEIFVNTF